MGRAFEFRKARKFKRWGNMARVFTKLGKEITICARESGTDPDNNPRLRVLMQMAKKENMLGIFSLLIPISLLMNRIEMLKSHTKGQVSLLKSIINGLSDMAYRSGLCSAIDLGTSSPMISDK